MKTNNFFDPVRFYGLLKQDLLFNYKFYLWFLAGLGIGIFVYSYLIIRLVNTTPFYLTVYYNLYNLLLFAMIVFIGMSFPYFRNQMKTSFYLLTPGSAFEKVLIQVVVRFVLFIPLALILLRLGVFLAISSMLPDPRRGFDPLFMNDFSFRELFTHSDFLRNSPLRDLSWLFLAFAGSVYFRKYAIVKTLVAMLFLPVTLFLVSYFVGIGRSMYWVGIVTEYLSGKNFIFGLAPIFIGILLLSLPWTYLKLKEKEL